MGKSSHNLTRGSPDTFIQGTITMQVNKIGTLLKEIKERKKQQQQKTISEQMYYHIVQPPMRGNHRSLWVWLDCPNTMVKGDMCKLPVAIRG